MATTPGNPYPPNPNPAPPWPELPPGDGEPPVDSNWIYIRPTGRFVALLAVNALIMSLALALSREQQDAIQTGLADAQAVVDAGNALLGRQNGGTR